jgi:RNA polymerase sigma factor (sigma-70 family)
MISKPDFFMKSEYSGDEQLQLDNRENELFESHIALSKAIALEYLNIPMVDASECISIAQQALWRAANGFVKERGTFTSYASKSIRNALNSLYAKQLKLARIFPDNLQAAPNWPEYNDPIIDSSIDEFQIYDEKQSIQSKVRLSETRNLIQDLLRTLTPRENIVIDYIKKGHSYSEIGNFLGVSKQAAHKIATGALENLRMRLEESGFKGVDSYGFLKERNDFSVG